MSGSPPKVTIKYYTEEMTNDVKLIGWYYINVLTGVTQVTITENSHKFVSNSQFPSANVNFTKTVANVIDPTKNAYIGISYNV